MALIGEAEQVSAQISLPCIGSHEHDLLPLSELYGDLNRRTQSCSRGYSGQYSFFLGQQAGVFGCILILDLYDAVHHIKVENGRDEPGPDPLDLVGPALSQKVPGRRRVRPLLSGSSNPLI